MPGRFRDKPKHTAYAFGELRGSKAREAEIELAEMEGGDALIDDLIETADLLKHGFKEEPELFLTSEQRKLILSGRGESLVRPTSYVAEVPVGASDLADAVLRRGRYAKLRHLKIAAAAAVVVSAGVAGSVTVFSEKPVGIAETKSLPKQAKQQDMELLQPMVVSVVAANSVDAEVEEAAVIATSSAGVDDVVVDEALQTTLLEEIALPTPPVF